MKKFKHIKLLPVAIALTLSGITHANTEASANMKAFPAAKQGMVRHVLVLPEKEDESAFKVELIVGKTELLEPQNHYRFTGSIEQETIEGWGFTSYVVRDLGMMAGTLMAIDPKQPKVNRFITLSAEPYFVRYNSRLPIVIYLPDGAEVKYRIWSAGEKTLPIDKG